MEHLDKLITVKKSPKNPEEYIVSLNLTHYVVPPYSRTKDTLGPAIVQAHEAIKRQILQPVIEEILDAQQEIREACSDPLPQPRTLEKVMHDLLTKVTTNSTICLNGETTPIK